MPVTKIGHSMWLLLKLFMLLPDLPMTIPWHLCHCSILSARTGRSLVSRTGKKGVLYSYILGKKSCALLCQRSHVLYYILKTSFVFFFSQVPVKWRSYKLYLAQNLDYILGNIKRGREVIHYIYQNKALTGYSVIRPDFFSSKPIILNEFQLIY